LKPEITQKPCRSPAGLFCFIKYIMAFAKSIYQKLSKNRYLFVNLNNTISIIMKNLTLLLLIFLPFMINAQKNSVKNINELSFNLLQQINKTEGQKNIFISAYSIYNAMGMTYLGAKDETKTEMENVLFPIHNTDIAEDLKKLNESLSFNRKIEFYSANNMWIKQNIEIKKRYSKAVKGIFDADVQQANFSDKQVVEQARQNINQWVEEKTKNQIKDFISKGVLDESTVFVLVNAIYYYAKWKIQFEEKNTYQDEFKSIDNNNVKTMFMHSVFSIPYYKNNELTAIEIPYENNEASFIIILPDDFETFAQKMDNKYFEKIITGFKNKNVNLSIPKFKKESEYDLVEYFKNMGLNSLFSSKADLSGITGNKDIRISNILHKAVIEINESGTEASAATAVIGSRSVSGNKETVIFKADRPFFYFIRENSTGTILFAGSFVSVE
jgi:serpin B